jgi:hypothetical protein
MHTITALCPKCDRELTIEIVDESANSGSALVTCDHCGVDKPLNSFVAARDKRTRRDERAAARQEKRQRDAEWRTARRTRVAAAHRDRVMACAEEHATRVGHSVDGHRVPQYGLISTISAILMVVGAICCLVILFCFLACIGEGRVDRDSLFLSSVYAFVGGVLSWGLAAALEALRHIAINSWYVRYDTAAQASKVLDGDKEQ